MSKLPNAPLIEVIFEIRWEMKGQQEFDKFELLIGSMHDALNDTFPIMRNLKHDHHLPLSFFNNAPTHRFESSNGYPLYQLGPGILSVNTVDAHYEWSEFKRLIEMICKCFIEKMNFNQNVVLSTSLKYLDFYKINPMEYNLNDYFSRYLKLQINSSLFSDFNNPLFSNFATAYSTNIGVLGLQIVTGEYNGIKGVIVDSTMTGKFDENHSSEIQSWIENAHEYISDFFKKMTKGELYESFN